MSTSLSVHCPPAHLLFHNLNQALPRKQRPNHLLFHHASNTRNILFHHWRSSMPLRPHHTSTMVVSYAKRPTKSSSTSPNGGSKHKSQASTSSRQASSFASISYFSAFCLIMPITCLTKSSNGVKLPGERKGESLQTKLGNQTY